MHSPWGMLDQICEQKGWTVDYILEQVTWSNIQMMIADKIQYVKASEMVQKVSKENLKKHREQLRNG